MSLHTAHLERLGVTLGAALHALQAETPGSVAYDVYRQSVVKRKALKAYTANPRDIDALSYKDVFRLAVRHGLIAPELAERWFTYRDNRNNTAHDYGEAFAEETLKLLPAFLKDVMVLIERLQAYNDDATI
jgi:hypothetical protein